MATVFTPWMQQGKAQAGTLTNQDTSNYNQYYADRGVDPKTLSTNFADQAAQSDYTNSLPTGAALPKPVAQQQQATDNSGLISQMYGQQLSAAQDALKKSIQQSMGQYQGTISQAPQQYQPLRDQASAAGYQNLNSLRELLANNGQQGGVNRTETTAVNSATENNINKLNLQQQNVIDTANKSIADLQAQGDIQGAQLVAQNASDKIKALIDESNRVSSTNYQYSQDALKNSMNEAQLTGNYNGQQTLSAKNSALQNALAEAGVTGTYNGAPTLAASNAADNKALQLGQMMGTYNGQDTLAAKDAQQQQALGLAQLLGYTSNGTPTLGRDTLNADTTYKNAALAASMARSSGSSGSRSSSGSSTSNQNNYYNNFISQLSGKDGEEAYKEMMANADELRGQMGASNFNKAINSAQDQYYNQVLARWNGNYDGLKQEINADSEHASYYQQVLGLDNFNKILKL